MMTTEQKADWLSQRCGKLTGSNMHKAMAFLKNGQPAKERIEYMYELLAERMTGDNYRHYVTDAMQWGTDHEDEAADRFVELTGRDLRPSHFYDHPTIPYFGSTPDRELDDGGMEIKCPTTPKFLRWKLAGVVPEEHKPQMLAQMCVTGWKWMGFVAFDPRVKDERHQLFMAKYVPEPEQIANIEKAAKQFLDELELMWSQLTEGV